MYEKTQFSLKALRKVVYLSKPKPLTRDEEEPGFPQFYQNRRKAR
jgi:hypothetical protein